MRLGTFLDRQKAAEQVKKGFGSTKRFDARYKELVANINLAIEKEKPGVDISQLPRSTDFSSPKVLKAYGEFHVFLRDAVDNLLSQG